MIYIILTNHVVGQIGRWDPIYKHADIALTDNNYTCYLPGFYSIPFHSIPSK